MALEAAPASDANVASEPEAQREQADREAVEQQALAGKVVR
jgi:hypothetical protein